MADGDRVASWGGLTPSLTGQALSSKWDGLSPHLIASFFEVARTGTDTSGNATWGRIENKTDPTTVMAPLADASLEMVLNWQSPFELSGPESKSPALMAMLQSGTLQPVIDAVFGKKNGFSQQLKDKSDSFLSQFEGRTGITKLNSTQVFNGMPPVKITITALFRAWSNPVGEVETPFDKLMEWALPVKLAGDSTLLSRAAQAVKGSMGYVEALMPSKSPTRIAMRYKGRTFSPLVIESIGMPLNSPVDANGKFVELVVPLTLCSLTALDRQDWSDTKTVTL